MKALDDILDDFGHEVVNNTQQGRTLLKRKPRAEIKAIMLELIGELNDGDWRKPVNSDELRQKVEAL